MVTKKGCLFASILFSFWGVTRNMHSLNLFENADDYLQYHLYIIIFYAQSLPRFSGWNTQYKTLYVRKHFSKVFQQGRKDLCFTPGLSKMFDQLSNSWIAGMSFSLIALFNAGISFSRISLSRVSSASMAALTSFLNSSI